jgi:TPR repeat protein
MTRTPGDSRTQLVLSALTLAGFLVFTSGAFAGPGNIPNVQAEPQPHTIDQQIKLANDYFVGRGVVQDFQQSAYWFEKAAQAGDPRAQLQTGYFYEAGIGVAKNPALAAHWYQLAASNGLATAKVNLAVLYFWGNGLKEDQPFAARLLREAAAKGSGRAACYLGDMYYSGVGVPQDRAVGEEWYLRGAGLHDPQAEYNLGLLFFDRKDHVHDLRKAAELLRESVAAGYAPAMYALGLLLARNPNLANSPRETITLLNDSAKAGIWKSSMILGVLARDGKSVPLDSNSAYYHFRVAALQGGQQVQELLAYDLRQLSARLSPDQISSLDAEAVDWYSQHHVVLEFVSREKENRARFPDYALAFPEDSSHAVQMLPALPD